MQRLAPDWKKQTLRCVVACTDAEYFHWRRITKCHCQATCTKIGLDASCVTIRDFSRGTLASVRRRYVIEDDRGRACGCLKIL